MKVLKDEYGKLNHKTIYSYSLLNDKGIEIHCSNYGCIITKILAPDRDGIYENIVLGYDTLEEYAKDPYYLGAIIGRVAGRIKDGRFDLDGKSYHLVKNGKHHLHGGDRGFNKVIWNAKTFENDQEVGVSFSYLSKDGEEGYPGNLAITVTYSLNNQNELSIRYAGRSDKKTILSMTNHSYLNLSGNLKRDILNHSLKIDSETFLELSNEFLPTGEMLNVSGTPFDFSTERLIRTGIESDHPQLKLVGGGYDHPFLLSNRKNNEIVLKDGESGRTLTIETNEVGVVVYSGNQLNSNGHFRKHLGICLETQSLPDAIHYPHFPSYILEQNQEYSRKSIYKFGIL
ncbi:aldose epimerase family protein [Pseudoneobacillus sp. C159]